MSKIFNGTPHPINVIANSVSDPTIRKMVVPADVKPEIVVSIPSTGVLSAKIDSIDLEPINDIPAFGKKIASCDPIPEGYDVVIVSALYVSAARERWVWKRHGSTPSPIRSTRRTVAPSWDAVASARRSNLQATRFQPAECLELRLSGLFLYKKPEKRFING